MKRIMMIIVVLLLLTSVFAAAKDSSGASKSKTSSRYNVALNSKDLAVLTKLRTDVAAAFPSAKLGTAKAAAAALRSNKVVVWRFSKNVVKLRADGGGGFYIEYTGTTKLKGFDTARINALKSGGTVTTNEAYFHVSSALYPNKSKNTNHAVSLGDNVKYQKYVSTVKGRLSKLRASKSRSSGRSSSKLPSNEIKSNVAPIGALLSEWKDSQDRIWKLRGSTYEFCDSSKTNCLIGTLQRDGSMVVTRVLSNGVSRSTKRTIITVDSSKFKYGSGKNKKTLKQLGASGYQAIRNSNSKSKYLRELKTLLTGNTGAPKQLRDALTKNGIDVDDVLGGDPRELAKLQAFVGASVDGVWRKGSRDALNKKIGEIVSGARSIAGSSAATTPTSSLGSVGQKFAKSKSQVVLMSHTLPKFTPNQITAAKARNIKSSSFGDLVATLNSGSGPAVRIQKALASNGIDLAKLKKGDPTEVAKLQVLVGERTINGYWSQSSKVAFRASLEEITSGKRLLASGPAAKKVLSSKPGAPGSSTAAAAKVVIPKDVSINRFKLPPDVWEDEENKKWILQEDGTYKLTDGTDVTIGILNSDGEMVQVVKKGGVWVRGVPTTTKPSSAQVSKLLSKKTIQRALACHSNFRCKNLQLSPADAVSRMESLSKLAQKRSSEAQNKYNKAIAALNKHKYKTAIPTKANFATMKEIGLSVGLKPVAGEGPAQFRERVNQRIKQLGLSAQNAKRLAQDYEQAAENLQWSGTWLDNWIGSDSLKPVTSFKNLKKGQVVVLSNGQSAQVVSSDGNSVTVIVNGKKVTIKDLSKVKTVKEGSKKGVLIWAGRTEFSEALGGILSVGSRAQAYQPLSNLLFKEKNQEYINFWNVDLLRLWATLPAFASREFCEAVVPNNYNPPGKDSVFVQTASGTYQFVGSIQAEKTSRNSKIPMICDPNPDEEDTKNPYVCKNDYVCKKDRFCYEDEDSTEPVVSTFYKITWGVTAPQDEAQTPNIDENGKTVKFNVALYKGTTPKWVYVNAQGSGSESTIALSKGQRDGATIATFLDEPGYTKACIVFNDQFRPRDLGRGEGILDPLARGKKVPDICVDIQTSSKGAVEYSQTQGTQPSTQTTSKNVKLNI